MDTPRRGPRHSEGNSEGTPGSQRPQAAGSGPGAGEGSGQNCARRGAGEGGGARAPPTLTSTPKRQERWPASGPGRLSPGPSPGARPVPLPPTQGRAAGRSPDIWSPPGTPLGTPPGTPPGRQRARSRRCPRRRRLARAHLCAKSPGAGGKLPATCHTEAGSPGMVLGRVRQRLSPLRARSRPTPRRSLLLAERSAAPPSRLPAPVIRGAGPGAALPAPPLRGTPGVSAAQVGPQTRTHRVEDPDIGPCPGFAVWEVRGPCHPPAQSCGRTQACVIGVPRAHRARAKMPGSPGRHLGTVLCASFRPVYPIGWGVSIKSRLRSVGTVSALSTPQLKAAAFQPCHLCRSAWGPGPPLRPPGILWALPMGLFRQYLPSFSVCSSPASSSCIFKTYQPQLSHQTKTGFSLRPTCMKLVQDGTGCE